jgi:hypothetical protein
MAVSRRRAAAVLVGLLAASAAPLLASGPAGAVTAAGSSSVSIIDSAGDVIDIASSQTPVPVITGAPQFDITAAGASDKDGRIVLSMVTGGADDLSGSNSGLYWPLYVNGNTDITNPDYLVSALHDNNVWSVVVSPASVDDPFDPANQVCPTGTSMAYDAAAFSYTAAFNASCIGNPGSLRFTAQRIGIGVGPNSDQVARDSAPDNAQLSEAVVTGTSHGYWMVGSDGKVYAFGGAQKVGEPAGAIAAPAVDLEPTPTGDGYWVVDELGHVYAYNAKNLGNVDPAKLSAGEKVTSLSATPKGDGYWIFTSKGRVFTFGAAQSFGDMSGTPLNGPVLDSIPTPSGQGYYMVGSDGGVFSFGDARYEGSMGGKPLNAPVQSLVPDPDGKGYWLVASDGGIFAFAADFHGSMGNKALNKPMTGMVSFGNGYLMVAEDGGIFDFSDQPFDGSLGSTPPAHPIVSVAALPVPKAS